MTGAVTHSEHIRAIINNAKRGPEIKPKKGTASKKPLQDEAPSISIEPLGQNRNRQRIWALDGRFAPCPCTRRCVTHVKTVRFVAVVLLWQSF